MNKIVNQLTIILKILLLGASAIVLAYFAILFVPGLDPLIAGYLYENDNVIKDENLEFEYEPIDYEIIKEIREKEGDDICGIKNIRWNNSILIIDSIITATCSDPYHRIIGGYELNGDTISLFISNKFYSSFRYSCIGWYNITFKIKNLEQKNYSVLLYRGCRDKEGQKSLIGAVQSQEMNSTTY